MLHVALSPCFTTIKVISEMHERSRKSIEDKLEYSVQGFLFFFFLVCSIKCKNK